MRRLLFLALVVATLGGCGQREQLKTVWDQDGCAFTLTTWSSTPPTSIDAWGQTLMRNVKVVRNYDQDKPTCVRNPRGQ